MKLIIFVSSFYLLFAFKVIRKETGDENVEGGTCNEGTYIAQDDATHSLECRKFMSEEGCNLEFINTRPKEVLFIPINRTNFMNVELKNNGTTQNICPDGYTMKTKFQLQDYPSNIEDPIWVERNFSEWINITFLSRSKVSILFNAHWPGNLLKISINCINNISGSTLEGTRCVYAKFQGSSTYPLSSNNLPPTIATITPSKATSTPQITTTPTKTEPELQITRYQSGDKVPKGKSCGNATIVVRDDSTHSLDCMTTMTSQGCYLEFRNSQPNKDAFIPANRSSFTSLLIVNNKSDNICPTGYQMKTNFELQNYPTNLNEKVWVERNISEHINITILSSSEVSVQFDAHWVGNLIKISIICYEESTDSTLTDDTKCVFVKFEGTVNYPLPIDGLPPTAVVTTTSTTTSTPLITLTNQSPRTQSSTMTTTKKTSTPSAVPLKDDSDDNLALIAGLIAAVVFVLIIILIVLVCYYCRRRERKEDEQRITQTEVVKETNVIYKNSSFDQAYANDAFDFDESLNHFYDDPKAKPEPEKRFITICNVDLNNKGKDNQDKESPYNTVLPSDHSTPVTKNFAPVSVNLPLGRDERADSFDSAPTYDVPSRTSSMSPAFTANKNTPDYAKVDKPNGIMMI